MLMFWLWRWPSSARVECENGDHRAALSWAAEAGGGRPWIAEESSVKAMLTSRPQQP